MDEAATPSTWWDNKEYASANYGAAELKELFGVNPFDFPKAQGLVADCLKASGAESETSLVLDFFAGSGTTGHAIIDLNRRDKGRRRYILVDSGRHCVDVIIPRIKKAVYSEQWKNGAPSSRNGMPHVLKVIHLESYEDALNNLELKRTSQQASLLEQDDDLREQYTLSYMLDVESRGSQSLLNVESFHNPDQYKLKVERNGETQLVNVDLVETFNWLLGLTVKHIDVIRGVRVVEGTNPDAEQVLVLWRNLDETNNDALDKWFEKQDYNTKDQEYDLIYVNGDNNLENLRRGDQTWKVRLIEEEFQRLMFDVQDV
jgi:adenine-specific DNA-methyltransferase